MNVSQDKAFSYNFTNCPADLFWQGNQVGAWKQGFTSLIIFELKGGSFTEDGFKMGELPSKFFIPCPLKAQKVQAICDVNIAGTQMGVGGGGGYWNWFAIPMSAAFGKEIHFKSIVNNRNKKHIYVSIQIFLFIIKVNLLKGELFVRNNDFVSFQWCFYKFNFPRFHI